MMKKNLLSIFAASVVLTLTACGQQTNAPAAAPQAAAPATPRAPAKAASADSEKEAVEKAMLAFAKMLNIDYNLVDAMKKYVIDGEKEFENATAAQIFAVNDRHKQQLLETQKRGGCVPKDVVVDAERPTEILGDVARAYMTTVCENGNTVTTGRPTLFRKKDGEWKLDPSTFE